MKPKSKRIIEFVRGEIPPDDGHLSRIYGNELIPKPSYFRNKETGETYCYIAGGIGWPSPKGDVPGFAVVVGVGRPDRKGKEMPHFYALDEAEEKDVNRLLRRCVDLRDKWGFWECPDILRMWWGEHEKYLPFITELNIKLMKKNRNNEDGRFVISPPFDFEKPNAFEIYLRRIFAFLAGSESDERQLHLRECDCLRRYLANLPADAASKQPEDYPAAMALGGVIHTLALLRPWLRPVIRQREIPTTFEEYFQKEQEFGDLEEEVSMDSDVFEDTGELVETIAEARSRRIEDE